MTLPEVLLWQRLQGRSQGFKFRKHHPVGIFVLDFYCAAKRTAIEIDGTVHDMGNRPDRDLARDRWLSRENIRVLRISASEVLRDADAVAESVITYCADLPPPSAAGATARSEEHTSELQSLMRISYAVFCLKKK